MLGKSNRGLSVLRAKFWEVLPKGRPLIRPPPVFAITTKETFNSSEIFRNFLEAEPYSII